MTRKASQNISSVYHALGANLLPDGRVHFSVWAPLANSVDLIFCKAGKPDLTSAIAMQRSENDYFKLSLTGIKPGAHYLYRINGKQLCPDPVSRFLPYGLHGPSEVVDPNCFKWTDAKWKNQDFSDYIFYELHLGTFTPEGTFDAAIAKLPYLKKLGITCIELMPVAQFPGNRNWGYDGASLYAVQKSYGGPDGFKRFVNACHKQGLAVCLDVVYNHLGPEGNYLSLFGPYFTDKYKTPWGQSINYDDAQSDHVRSYFLQNALYWIKEYHIDALRLDAVHCIYDLSAKHLLEELQELAQQTCKTLGKPAYLIAESDLNDSRLLHSKKQGGYALDAQWSDDFHHATHALLTEEKNGYYSDFGSVHHLAKAFTETFVYNGTYSSHRQRRHGNSARGLDQNRFVTFSQNHDQIGNRAFGERLASLVTLPKQKSAVALTLLSPFAPLLFMGEEYAETNPFLYFTSHSDPNLGKAVYEGRKREFKSFGWQEVPDPQKQSSFKKSYLNWNRQTKPTHATFLNWTRDLISLRKQWKLASPHLRPQIFFDENEQWLAVIYKSELAEKRYGLFFSFASQERLVHLPQSFVFSKVLLNSDAKKYGGHLSSSLRWNPKKPLATVAVAGLLKK